MTISDLIPGTLNFDLNTTSGSGDQEPAHAHQSSEAGLCADTGAHEAVQCYSSWSTEFYGILISLGCVVLSALGYLVWRCYIHYRDWKVHYRSAKSDRLAW